MLEVLSLGLFIYIGCFMKTNVEIFTKTLDLMFSLGSEACKVLGRYSKRASAKKIKVREELAAVGTWRLRNEDSNSNS